MPSKLWENTMSRRFAPRQHLSISLNVKLGGNRSGKDDFKFFFGGKFFFQFLNLEIPTSRSW
jgi:hypothetical protein